jgi:PAS domain S-box-containing protein
MDTQTILVVDDDASFRKTLSDILRAKGYTIRVAGTAEAALKWAEEERPGVAVVDIRLEETSGLELVRALRERLPATECIVLTGYVSQASAIEAINVGVYSYLQKPCDVDQLLVTIRRALERQEAERVLKERERYFRSLLHTIREDIVVIDSDYKIVDMNDTYLASTGHRREEVIGQRCFAVSSGCGFSHDEQRERRMLREVFEAGEPRKCQHLYTRADGTQAWVDILFSPFKAETGEIAYVIESARDITDLMRAQEALWESEERVRLISGNVPVVVYSALPDAHSTNLFVSGRTSELTGYSGDQFMRDAELWSSIVHCDDRTRVWETIQEHRRTKRPLDVEYRIISRDNTIKWIRDKATPVLDQSGQIIRIDGFMEDITERKRVEEELRKHREHLEELVEERTADLRRMVNAMAGREIRMAELKDVIRKLRAQLAEAGLKPVADDPLLGEGS